MCGIHSTYYTVIHLYSQSSSVIFLSEKLRRKLPPLSPSVAHKQFAKEYYNFSNTELLYSHRYS
jgi:hypothetical protein